VKGIGRRPEGGDASGAGGVIRTALLAYGPLLVAAALTRIAAAVDGARFADVILLPPHSLPAWRLALAVGVTASGYFAVYLAPGLLLMRALGIRLPHAVGNAVAAFVLSLLGVSLAWIVAQAVTGGTAGRGCVYLTVAALDAAALVAGLALSPAAPALPRLPPKTAGQGRTELLVPVAGILLLVAAICVLMPGKISVESLEGDATEVRGFAASLAHGALPEWDLESGAWGFYPTFMFVSYPVFFSIALLGDTEAPVRLPALLFLGMMILATADLAARGRTRLAAGSLNVLVPMLVAGYLSAQIGAYYAGYHPWHGDLGCSPLEEWVVTALAMAALLLLRDGAPGAAAVAALLSILAFPSGLMLVGLIGVAGMAAGRREERRVLWRWGLALAALLIAYAALLAAYTLHTGTFGAMVAEWYEKYFRGRASFASESPLRVLRAIGWFFLMCGGLPLLALPLTPLRHDRMTRWMALLAAGWVGFFVLSPNKNVHYFLPAALLPMGVALRMISGLYSRPRLSAVLGGALVLSAIVCVVLCAPRRVPPYVADRELGERTVFLAPDERTAVEYSHVLYNVMKPLWLWRPGDPWTTGHHTWAMYADRSERPGRPYDFYVGTGPQPAPDLTEVTGIVTPGGESVKLWVRGGRATVREWKSREYPLRTELSRFSFDMAQR